MKPYVILNEAIAPELTRDWLLACAAALTKQYDEDFAPAHGTLPITIVVANDASDVPTGARVFHLKDSIPEAPSALAYHTRDAKGNPVLVLGVDTIRSQGGSLLDEISKAMSHEILETELNPYVSRWNDFDGVKKLAFEACDPVQGGSYTVDGIAVSDFVLPAYFDADDIEGPYNHLGTLVAPLSCAAAGYQSFDDGTQVFGEEVPDHVKRHAQEHARIAHARRKNAA